MARYKEKKSNGMLYVIIIVIVILLAICVYFIFNDKSITTNGNAISSVKNEVITEENYDTIMDKIGEEMKDDDDLYYLSYSTIYYMFQDGLSSAFTNPDDESAMYVNIYGKTVQQLIDEGKKLMQENDMTVDKFKEELKEANNNIIND